MAVLAPAAAQVPTLQTWHPWQLDSVLVAWALSRSQKPPPVFESVRRGAPIEPDRAIDTPDSRFRRNGHRTAFEEALRHTGLEHPCALKLREAIRIVELAAWRKPEFPLVEAFEVRVLRAVPAGPTLGGLERAFAEVDRYCEESK